MTLIVFTARSFRYEWAIYYVSFGVVFGQVLFPVWFFQGTERMQHITYLSIFAKSIFAVAIFLFVKKSTDYLYVPLSNSLGTVIAGIAALLIIFRNFGVKTRLPSFKSLKSYPKGGWFFLN